MTGKVQRVITLDQDEILAFCGEQDRKLKRIQSRLRAKVIPRGNEIRVSGSGHDVDEAYNVITDLLETQRSGRKALSDRELHHALNTREEGSKGQIGEMRRQPIQTPAGRKEIAPLTLAQKRYIDAIREKDIVFCVGPAGTGKTYLAVASAVESLMSGRVGRIILVRPAVEAGERLGFLPGDISQKFDPYVRPLYDALYEMLEPDHIREMIDNGTIEFAPLAFMRGRTLNASFVILDEAQNTSIEQMKMFLTRMGFETKLVITGDVTQVDLPRNRPSGLIHAQQILQDIPDVDFINFTRKDVVRHELVQRIIMAYEAHGKK